VRFIRGETINFSSIKLSDENITDKHKCYIDVFNTYSTESGKTLKKIFTINAVRVDDKFECKIQTKDIKDLSSTITLVVSIENTETEVISKIKYEFDEDI
jgi:hypothetical protein